MSRSSTPLKFRENWQDITGQNTRTDNDHDINNDQSTQNDPNRLASLTSMSGQQNPNTDFVHKDIAIFAQGAHRDGVLEDEDEEGNTKNRSGHSISARGGLIRAAREAERTRELAINTALFLTRTVIEPTKRTQPDKHSDDTYSVKISTPHVGTFNDAAHSVVPERRRLLNFAPVVRVDHIEHNRALGVKAQVLTNGTRRVIATEEECIPEELAGRIVTDRNGKEYLIARNEVRRQHRNAAGQWEYVDRRNVITDTREFALRQADSAGRNLADATGQKTENSMDEQRRLLAGEGDYTIYADNDNEPVANTARAAPATRPAASPRPQPQRSANSQPARPQSLSEAFGATRTNVENRVRHDVDQAVDNTRHAFNTASRHVVNAANDVGRNVSQTRDNAARWLNDVNPFNR